MFPLVSALFIISLPLSQGNGTGCERATEGGKKPVTINQAKSYGLDVLVVIVRVSETQTKKKKSLSVSFPLVFFLPFRVRDARVHNGRSEEIFFRRVAQDFVDKSDEANRYCARVLNCRGFQRGKKRENHAKKTKTAATVIPARITLLVGYVCLPSDFLPLHCNPRAISFLCSCQPSRRTVFNDSIPRCASCQRRTYAKVGCSHQKKFKKRVRTAKKTKQKKEMKSLCTPLFPRDFRQCKLVQTHVYPSHLVPLPSASL